MRRGLFQETGPMHALRGCEETADSDGRRIQAIAGCQGESGAGRGSADTAPTLRAV
ncbi:MAG: hypothetical protein HY898_22810 [Deltaproteobacteria bacterium]|nr:hypothetical protein [Deltaproteobacteria bacterium]